ncbi:MAG TPA: hypothetical protein VF503_16040 [Sphingobium sp.]|uniref:hypothetical protein n=1 Tax=Sphingobium sp. TaxID=1912891 RepID=UPI002ED5A550
MPNLLRVSILMIAAILSGAPAIAHVPEEGTPVEQAQQLSAFGERPAFSPDGTRVTFVGKTYGDAYEIELATGRVRNLTGQFPHQGIVRVQYLPNGDYILVAPKRFTGPGSRFKLDLFVLAKDLRTGLRPLNQEVHEGIALGPNGLIAWQQVPAGSKLRDGENWLTGALRVGLEHYVGRVAYRGGVPMLVDKQRIMTPPPSGCMFMEVQDFRNDGREIVFYAGCQDLGGPQQMRIIGYDLKTRHYTTFLATADYAEVEGVAPDGKWASVECGTRTPGAMVPPLDICRLELVPNGKLSRLIIGTAPGSTEKVSNPVVSPDGKAVAFQSADGSIGDIGEGAGIYLMRLDK